MLELACCTRIFEYDTLLYRRCWWAAIGALFWPYRYLFVAMHILEME
jgi:hypothetical protein